MKVSTVATRTKSQPLSARGVRLISIGPDEILVGITTVGLRHTDITIPNNPRDYFPIMAHEGTGLVEKVGDQVTKVKPGDQVVLTHLSCGQCIPCQKGYPSHCLKVFGPGNNDTGLNETAALKKTGKTIGQYGLDKSSFSTYGLVTEANVVKVRSDVKLDLMGPLGGGIQIGAGAVYNTLHVVVGSSIAIFGLDSIGLSAVMAAAVSGCTFVIAVDNRPERLQLAKSLGASHTIDAANPDQVKLIQRITGSGVNYSIETTARPIFFRRAIEVLDRFGVCGLVGCPPPGTKVTFDMHSITFGRTIRGTTEIDNIPDVFIPQLIDLYMEGNFPITRLITMYEFNELSQAVDDIANGRVINPILKI